MSVIGNRVKVTLSRVRIPSSLPKIRYFMGILTKNAHKILKLRLSGKIK